MPVIFYYIDIGALSTKLQGANCFILGVKFRHPHIPFPSNFPYQAARPACRNGRPPHMAVCHSDGLSFASLHLFFIVNLPVRNAPCGYFFLLFFHALYIALAMGSRTQTATNQLGKCGIILTLLVLY